MIKKPTGFNNSVMLDISALISKITTFTGARP